MSDMASHVSIFDCPLYGRDISVFRGSLASVDGQSEVEIGPPMSDCPTMSDTFAQPLRSWPAAPDDARDRRERSPGEGRQPALMSAHLPGRCLGSESRRRGSVSKALATPLYSPFDLRVCASRLTVSQEVHLRPRTAIVTGGQGRRPRASGACGRHSSIGDAS